MESATKHFELVRAMSEYSENEPQPKFSEENESPFDLHQWTSEIEDFVADISRELNEIAQTLGDQPSWQQKSDLPGETYNSQPPNQSSSHRDGETKTNINAPSELPDSSSDRLQMLKQRLASRNKSNHPDQES